MYNLTIMSLRSAQMMCTVSVVYVVLYCMLLLRSFQQICDAFVNTICQSLVFNKIKNKLKCIEVIHSVQAACILPD